jgi:Putative MetA-pathway of phenol degradation
MVAALAGGLIFLCSATSSYAQNPAPIPFYEIETKYIFGFTEGSGIGLEGEKEISIETVARMGKRDGSYFASETRFEFEFTPSQYIQIELGPLAAANYIRNVPGLDNRNTFQPSGFFGEIRYLLLDRPNSPLAVTLSFEPNYRAFDETSGVRVENYEFETKINADLEIVKNRLYAAFNLIYEPETTRFHGAWAKESTFGATGALAFRFTPALTMGAEVDYYRHYDGFFFNSFTGHAIFIGPTLHYQISPKMFMTAAWNAQVWGRETDTGNRLNLEEFSRYRAQLKLALEF